MSCKLKTVTQLIFHQKVVHNLSQIKTDELDKVIKKHSKIVDTLRSRIKSKGWG